MNDADISQMGEHARLVLANPAFQEAFKRLQGLSKQAFLQTSIRDAEGLKIARQFQAVTDDVESILRRMIEGGKLAQINMDRHRDEGPGRRALRKVSW